MTDYDEDEIITINDDAIINQARYHALANNLIAFGHQLSHKKIINRMDGLFGLSSEEWMELYNMYFK